MSIVELNLACCAVEAAEGVELWRSSVASQQAAAAVKPNLSVLVVAGTVTNSHVDLVRESYTELPEPRAVIAFGVCTISGGPYWDSYAVHPGIADLVPVDAVVPGCPPQPDDVVAALDQLAAKCMEPHASTSGT